MQKLKKALNKLTQLGSKKAAPKPASHPAQASKKAVSSKKKTQVVAAAKPVHKVAVKKASAAPIKKAAHAPAHGAGHAPSAASKPAPKAPAGKTVAAHGAKAEPAKDGKKRLKATVVPEVKGAKAAHAAHGAAAKPASKVAAAKAPAKAPDKPTAEKAGVKKPVAAVKKVSGSDRSSEKNHSGAPTAAELEEIEMQADIEIEEEEEVIVVEENPKAARLKKTKNEQAASDAAQDDEEVVLTDADGRRYCRVNDCDQASTVDAYCRFHYLLFWKNIQNRKKILSEGKLERYIEELTARYPDKYLELLRKDLRSEKDFTAAIQELEIDDSGADNEFEDEAQSYLDEVRGMSSEPTNEREEDF
jgi:hypothetical protein